MERRMNPGDCCRYRIGTGCNGAQRRLMQKWVHHYVQKQQKREQRFRPFHRSFPTIDLALKYARDYRILIDKLQFRFGLGRNL